MRLLVGVLFAIMAVAPTAYADEASEVREIKRYMNFLNSQPAYPNLNVRNKNNLKNANVRTQVYNQLQALENHLQGDVQLDDAALKELLCGRPVCDGGDEVRRRQAEQ
jgi:hypothetical protein